MCWFPRSAELGAEVEIKDSNGMTTLSPYLAAATVRLRGGEEEEYVGAVVTGKNAGAQNRCLLDMIIRAPTYRLSILECWDRLPFSLLWHCGNL